MSNLTELLPAGGSGKTVDFVASGTLPNGKPVILKADGTVEVVGESSTSITESIPAGSEYVFNSGGSHSVSVSFDPNNANKFVVVYYDGSNSYYGTAIVGTVTGTSISFGTAAVFTSGSVSYTSVSFDPNTANKFVVTYADWGNSGYATAIIGTVSGTSISFGSSAVFNSGDTDYISVSFDPNNANKFVIAYRDRANSEYGTAIVGTVSGTSISYGSEYTFNNANTTHTSIAFDPNTTGKFVVAYMDEGTHTGNICVGSVSGTSISFGAEYSFSAGTARTSVSFDPNTAGKFVVTYQDEGNAQRGTAIVGTVSGTTATFGSEYVFYSNLAHETSVAFDPNTSGKFVIAYRRANTYYGKAIVGTVSGTSLSFGSAYTFNSANTISLSVSFDPNTSGKFVIAYDDNGNSDYGTAIVGQIATIAIVTNLTADNFLGTSTEAYADTDPATILLQGGISTNQSGLTIGSDYYVQGDGTLATTADTISVKLGKALSATSILLSGE